MNNGPSMILVSSISSGEVQFWLVSQLSQNMAVKTLAPGCLFPKIIGYHGCSYLRWSKLSNFIPECISHDIPMIIGYLKSSPKNMVNSCKFIGHLTHPRNDSRHFWDHLAAEELTASAALKWWNGMGIRVNTIGLSWYTVKISR